MEAGNLQQVFDRQDQEESKQKIRRKLTLLGSDKFEEVKRLMHLKEMALE